MTCCVQPKRRVSLGCLSALPLSACASAHQNAAAKSSDEVSFGCWESNADVKAWMAKHAMGTNLTLLNNYYMSNLLKIIKGTMNKTAMFWRPGAADSLPQTEVPAGEPPPRSLLASGLHSSPPVPQYRCWQALSSTSTARRRRCRGRRTTARRSA